MTEYLRGRVIKIEDPTTVLVEFENEGRAAEGMSLIAYEIGPAILDSKGETLGRYELQKARMRIVHTQPGFSIARSSDLIKHWVGDGPPPFDEGDFYDPAMEDPNWAVVRRQIARLPAHNPTPASAGSDNLPAEKAPTIGEILKLTPKDEFVVVGDRVRSVAPVA